MPIVPLSDYYCDLHPNIASALLQRTKHCARRTKYRVLIIKLQARLTGRAVDWQFYADATKFHYVVQS